MADEEWDALKTDAERIAWLKRELGKTAGTLYVQIEQLKAIERRLNALEDGPGQS